MAHVSLYRRYRPGRFAALRGQDHVVRALTHAVDTSTHSHAYLFSGPRGTGKTSTARILAKALNCTNLSGGEPCGECESCRAIEAGTSYDLFELDAASNNGVDAMRDLIGRTAVGSPGRTKVYILDEVHMLSPAASNALLKTLEEPPDHVTFVLATTDPQKVLPTIRSRAQHHEFRLLTAAELEDYVRWVVADAGLELDEASITQVVRQGRGSARDTLSALDLAVAAGGLDDRTEPIEGILTAIAAHDVAGGLVAVADAVAQGREPRVLAEALIATLRDAFLVAVGADRSAFADVERDALEALAKRLGTPTITRGLEAVGSALVDMRQASDPRVPLEVALIRLCDAHLDASPAALLERIEHLERGARGRLTSASAPSSGPAATAMSPESADDGPDGAAEAAPRVGAGSAAARLELARSDRPVPPATPRRGAPPVPPRRSGRSAHGEAPPGTDVEETLGSAPASDSTPEVDAPPAGLAPDAGAATPSATTPPAATPPAATPPAATPLRVGASTGSELPTRDELALAMGDAVLASLRGIAKAIYSGGRFVSVDAGAAVFALNNAATRDRAERVRADVEAALAQHFGRPVPLRLVDEASIGDPPDAAVAPVTATPRASASVTTTTAAGDDDDDEAIDLADIAELEDAPVPTVTGVDRLVEAFPGAVVVEQEDP